MCASCVSVCAILFELGAYSKCVFEIRVQYNTERGARRGFPVQSVDSFVRGAFILIFHLADCRARSQPMAAKYETMIFAHVQRKR